MKKIAIVVGHRKGSQGAYGNAGLSEWKFNKKLASEIKERTDRLGKNVKIFFRKEHGTGYTQRMKELHRDIDDWGADITISLHFNASSHAYANGHEVLYCSSSRRSGEYARQMNDLFSQYLNNRDRGVLPRGKKNRGGGFLCRGRSNCILVEPFFASHQHEYMPGTPGREALIKSIVTFISINA